VTVVRVGLLGLGEVAQAIHLPTLSDLRTRFAITGVFDVSPSLMQLVCSRYANVRAFDSARSLVEDSNIDAVFILSSDETHSGFVRMAVTANKHILLEKPACLTVREIDGLLELTADYRKTIFVGYMRRYAPAFLAAKTEMPLAAQITHVRIFDLISEGRIFMQHSQDILYPSDISPDILTKSAKDRDALLREVVGADAPADLVRAYRGLTALSSHHLSAMRELLGEPERVIAAHRTNGGANTTVMFDYGHYAAHYDAVVDDLGLFDAMIEVRTPTKRLRIIYDTPYIRSLPTRLEIAEGTNSSVHHRVLGPFYSDAFTEELKTFHQHVQDGTKPKTDLADSRRDLVLMADIIDKMRQAKRPKPDN
jgi:virulence factor